MVQVDVSLFLFDKINENIFEMNILFVNSLALLTNKQVIISVTLHFSH